MHFVSGVMDGSFCVKKKLTLTFKSHTDDEVG